MREISAGRGKTMFNNVLLEERYGVGVAGYFVNVLKQEGSYVYGR